MNIMAMRWAKLYKGTPAELALEPHIAALGIPYRSQFPYFLWGVKYFPDFLLPTVGVIVEVDDPSHETPEKKEADALRTSALERLGYRVVRCTNGEALYSPAVIIARIRDLLATEGPRDLGLPSAPSRTKRPTPGARRSAKTPPPSSPARGRSRK